MINNIEKILEKTNTPNLDEFIKPVKCIVNKHNLKITNYHLKWCLTPVRKQCFLTLNIDNEKDIVRKAATEIEQVFTEQYKYCLRMETMRNWNFGKGRPVVETEDKKLRIVWAEWYNPPEDHIFYKEWGEIFQNLNKDIEEELLDNFVYKADPEDKLIAQNIIQKIKGSNLEVICYNIYYDNPTIHIVIFIDVDVDQNEIDRVINEIKNIDNIVIKKCFDEELEQHILEIIK